MPASPQNLFPAPATTSGYQTIVGSCSAADRLRLYNGNLTLRLTLVDVPTVSTPLRFFLFYNAQDTVYGAVGNKWRHNYMTSLIITGAPPTYITLVSMTGHQYGFVDSGGAWQLDTAGGYGFFNGVLTPDGTNWRITFPSGAYDEFDASGNLISRVDNDGNAFTVAYSGGNVATITEPRGRQITLSYNVSGLLSGVEDPMGNTTSLSYDLGNDNLTMVAGPTGCVTSFGHADPTNHLVTSRTDPLNNTYQYTCDGSGRLTSVTDPQAHSIAYTYDTVSEMTGGDPVAFMNFPRTTLTDARGKIWEYRFDISGNLRRSIAPNANSSYLYWDQVIPGQGISQQQPLSEASGFPYNGQPLATTATRNRYRIYDSVNNNGNLLYSTDGDGRITQNTYDGANNLLSTCPGQAHLGVQGNWVGQYGTLGYVLCAFHNASSDAQSLPSFVSGVTRAGVTRVHLGESAPSWNGLMDPRTLVGPNSLSRNIGFWVLSGSGPQVTVSLNEAASFNLSFYLCANDLAYSQSTPFQYNEQFGHDVTLTVTDANGTWSHRVYNCSGGVWVTFPVHGDATHAVTVSGVASGSGTLAGFSAMMFDPYDSHRTTYTYTPTNNLASTTDGLGNQSSNTYNADGTPATHTDANGHETQYFYDCVSSFL